MDDYPVPAPNQDVDPQLADLASELQDMVGVSPDLIALMQRGLHSTKLPTKLRTAKAAEAFDQVFQVIGGVPRLALWADKNPDKFYQLYGRMIGATMAPVVPRDAPEVNTPESKWLSARRLLYQEALTLAQDIEVKKK